MTKTQEILHSIYCVFCTHTTLLTEHSTEFVCKNCGGRAMLSYPADRIEPVVIPWASVKEIL